MGQVRYQLECARLAPLDNLPMTVPSAEQTNEALRLALRVVETRGDKPTSARGSPSAGYPYGLCVTLSPHFCW
jgi:hypothetical protein